MPRRSPYRSSRSKAAVAMGKVLRTRRKALGLTQEQFAELVNLSKNYVGNMERGEYEVSISTLSQIGEAIGIRASKLLEEAEL